MTETASNATIKGRIGVIPGSWEPRENWDRFVGALSNLGLETDVVDNLPLHDRDATRSDHARAAADKLKAAGAPISVLVVSSGGGHLAQETIDNLHEDGIAVGHLAHFSSSLGEPEVGTLGDPLRAAIPRERSSYGFRHSIKKQANGETIFKERWARRYLFNAMPRAMARLAIKSMTPQYRLPEPPLPESYSVPGTYFRGTRDRVRSRRWARAVSRALGLEWEEVPGAGHALHMSKPEEMAQRIGRIADNVNRPAPFVPGQRVSRESGEGVGLEVHRAQTGYDAD